MIGGLGWLRAAVAAAPGRVGLEAAAAIAVWAGACWCHLSAHCEALQRLGQRMPRS
jgi:hypothetical protein